MLSELAGRALTPELIKRTCLNMIIAIPRYVSQEPGAETLIETTRAVTKIEDGEPHELILEYFLPALQTQIKRGEAHHAEYKAAFHAAHKAACTLESEDVGAALNEFDRLKRLVADSDFAEWELYLIDIDKKELIKAMLLNPRYLKFLQINMAAVTAQLKADGELLNIPGVKIGKRGRLPVIRQSKS